MQLHESDADSSSGVRQPEARDAEDVEAEEEEEAEEEDA